MPSLSYQKWDTLRRAALDQIESAHGLVGGTARGRRYATQQINHAYAVLLSSQFQGFCRDLHSECAGCLARTAKPDALGAILRFEFIQNRKLDKGNPNPGNIGSDFNRLGIAFWSRVGAHDARNNDRRDRLEQLNGWRNAIAHQYFDPAKLGGTTTLRLETVRSWRRATDGLAASFEAVMQAYLTDLTGSPPWWGGTSCEHSKHSQRKRASGSETVCPFCSSGTASQGLSWKIGGRSAGAGDTCSGSKYPWRAKIPWWENSQPTFCNPHEPQESTDGGAAVPRRQSSSARVRSKQTPPLLVGGGNPETPTQMKPWILFAACAFVVASAAPRALMPPVWAATLKPGEGSDLEIGGLGVANGQFVRLRDMTFGPDGRLYTLETAGKERSVKGEVIGLGRVQVFSGDGQFQSAFSLGSDAQIEQAVTPKNEDGPMAAARLAVDGAGRVYVSFPIAGLVRVFGPDGGRLADVPLPNALALARRGDGKVLGLASQRIIGKNGWEWQGGDALSVLAPTGIESTIPLAQTLWNVQDAAVAPNGDVVVLAAGARPKYDWNPAPLLWRFSADGKVVSSLGSGDVRRSEDGSEPLHSVAVGKNGDVTAMTYGNPGQTVRYSADGKTVTTHAGWFKWADSWSRQSGYTILALDPSDRLWVGVTQVNDPGDPNFPQQNDRPVVLRVSPDFFDPGQKGVRVSDARALGFAPRLESPLPYNVAYAVGKPIEADVVVAPAKRNVRSVGIAFRVFDAGGNVVASGEKPLPLTDGQEARLPLSFTPQRFGAYSLVADYKAGADVLSAQAIHFGVTPRFADMPTLAAGQSPGGWEDAPRQAFTGLALMRLHPGKGGGQWRDKLGADLDAAQKAHVGVFVQLTDRKEDFTPQRAREVMEFIKGRVRYVELFNEPNFSYSPEQYVPLAQAAYDALKAVDPTVQVLGPDVCGISPGWHEAFYKAGGKTTCDILSVHDYEGHESISPEHWTWKLGELRRIMAKYGDPDKPIWQTERAISSVRGGLLTGLSQAIRITLHQDVLSSLGVPDAHDSHYYLNQGGYSDVPSYVWTDQGPLPAALATRTRAALLAGRPFVGTLDFGATGRTLFLGARYRDASGETDSLRNLVGAPMQVHFAAPPGAQVFDAWGNAVPNALQGRALTLNLGQLPTYVRLPAPGTITPRPWSWGADLALGAKVSIEGKSDGDPSNLTNGKLETIHADNPSGGTDGKAIVFLRDFSPTKPALVSLALPAPARFNAVLVRGLRADNGFSALLDFDVQARQNGVWKTVATGGTRVPPTVLGQTADATALTFYGDDNAWVLRFPPVQSDALRLVVGRGTFGFAPDETARKQVLNKWGGAQPQAASLREIEIYNAP